MRHAFGAIVDIPDEQWEELRRRVRSLDVPKGAILLREGEPVHWLAFLERGLLRNYRLVRDREVNLGFECEGGYAGAYDAFQRREPSQIAIQALEPSRLMRFERADIDALRAGHPCWRDLFGRVS